MTRAKRELTDTRVQGRPDSRDRLARAKATAEPAAVSDDRDELLTLQDVARLLEVSANTIYYWRYQRTGPKGHKVGRHVRYWRSDVLAWLRDREDLVSGLRPVRR